MSIDLTDFTRFAGNRTGGKGAWKVLGFMRCLPRLMSVEADIVVVFQAFTARYPA